MKNTLQRVRPFSGGPGAGAFLCMLKVIGLAAATCTACTAARAYTVIYGGPNNQNFTYTNGSLIVTGVVVRQTSPGLHPGIIINHGTNGNASGYSLTKANEMAAWGLVCVCPNLTHGTVDSDPDPTTWGYSPENLAREAACFDVLTDLGNVDMDRIAVWGHSRGAFLAIGAASYFGPQIKVLGFSSGGIHTNNDASDVSFPYVNEIGGIIAPSIMFYGTNDTVVLPSTSSLLQSHLNTMGVPNDRKGYTYGHNLHQDPTINADMLAEFENWLNYYGVLP